MRRLNESPGRRRRDDRGVASIFLVIAITVVLVGVGFAVDIGQYVVTARSAQNSADATVLAVATDCATNGSPGADYGPYYKDGQTISAPFCGSNESTITVTRDVGGLFLPSVTEGDVDRSATAAWGTLAEANTLPLVIADCEFGSPTSGVEITIYLDDPKPQTGCSSLSGGFGQLAGSGCSVPISADGYATGSPGNDLHKQVPCLTGPNGELPHTVLIPIYDSADCEINDCKGKGPYLIKGFAALEVTGYSLNGNNYAGTLGKKCPDDKDRGKNCLRGIFQLYTTGVGTPGDSVDYGVTQVYLVS